MASYYDWQALFSRQTGTNGERAIVLGGKNIGKTYGLRLALLRQALRDKWQLVELSRTKRQAERVARSFMKRLFANGEFAGREWDVKGGGGYLVTRSPDGDVLARDHVADFVALADFHGVKELSFERPLRYVMDEAVIDRRMAAKVGYLSDEWGLIAELIDSVSREQYDSPLGIKAYFLGNSVDISAPIVRGLGIERLPSFGYSWHDRKHTILHWVEPWDVEQRVSQTFAGRMLKGTEGQLSAIENAFTDYAKLHIEPLGKAAQFLYGLRLQGHTVGFWRDGFTLKASERVGVGKVYALTRADGSIDYPAIESSAGVCKIVRKSYFANALAYTSKIAAADTVALLGFLGVA